MVRYLFLLSILFLSPLGVFADTLYDFDTVGTAGGTLVARYNGVSTVQTQTSFPFVATSSFFLTDVTFYDATFNYSYESYGYFPSQEVVMYLYEGTATSTYAFTDIAFTDAVVNGYDSADVTFTFPSGVWIVEGVQYSLVIRPLVEDAYYNFAVQLRTYDSFFDVVTYNYYDDVYAYYQSRVPRARFNAGLGIGDAPIVLSQPCETSSYSAARCEYGLESGDFIPIQGIATPNMSLSNGMVWQVAAWLSLPSGSDSTEPYVYPESITYLSLTGDVGNQAFAGNVRWVDSIMTYAVLNVCLVPATGQLSQEASTNSRSCAQANIGYHISTASTTEYLDAVTSSTTNPRLNTGINIVTTPAPATASEDSWLTDRLTGLWSIYKYLWPWGYLTRTYDEYEAQQSASSSPLAIPLDMSRFGLPPTDTKFDLVAWASVDRWKNDPDYAGIAAGLEAFDKFMYGLLAMFLLYRVWSGVWTHGLEVGIARRKAEILESRDYERAAFFADLRNNKRR